MLPHFPHHVVQRGHNRQVVFVGPEDFERYRDDLRELSSVLDVRVYAYCLMTNHVHLLLGSGEMWPRWSADEGTRGQGHAVPQPSGRADRYTLENKSVPVFTPERRARDAL